MSCGLPVIGTQEAFTAIEIDNGVHSIVEEPQNFVGIIERMIEKPEICNEIGARARDFIIKNHSWEQVSNKYYSIYKGLLE